MVGTLTVAVAAPGAATTVTLVAVFFGVLVALSLFVPEFIPSKSMDKMPWPVIVLVSGFLGSGGLLALVGLNWWGDMVSRGWALERFGWLLATGGFTTYAISVSWHYPASVFAWGSFVSAVINFFIIAFIVFLLVKGVNRIKDAAVRKQVAEESAAGPSQEALLAEIRDILAAQRAGTVEVVTPRQF